MTDDANLKARKTQLLPDCNHERLNDILINEECQNHDSNSPQQHHKMHETNDDARSSKPSTGIINHATAVK
jgi:hypothetical protein